MRDISSYADKTVVLTQDIQISDIPEVSSASFKGTFDGKYNETIHKITYSSTTEKDNVAVFPFEIATGATVKNVNVEIEKSYIYLLKTNQDIQTVFSKCNGTAKGIKISGNVTLVYDKDKVRKYRHYRIGTIGSSLGSNSGKAYGKLEDSTVSITYDLQSTMTNEEIAQSMLDKEVVINICQLGNRASVSYKKCVGYGTYSESMKELISLVSNKINDNQENMESQQACAGMIMAYMWTDTQYATAENCYYDKNLFPDVEAVDEWNTIPYNNRLRFSNYEDMGKTTEEMKTESTYGSAFKFGYIWSISSDKNNGYPYYDPKVAEITLQVQADTKEKVWSTSKGRDYNRFVENSPNYHYPYRESGNAYVYDDGENNKVEVTGAKIVN